MPVPWSRRRPVAHVSAAMCPGAGSLRPRRPRENDFCGAATGQRAVTRTAYVDESARDGYLVCAVVVIGDPAVIRTSMRALARRGSSRVHMAKESPRQRRTVLSTVTAFPVEAHLVQTTLAGRSQREGRDRCLTELVGSVVAAGVDQLILESCDQDHQDRAVLAAALGGPDSATGLTYDHRRPREEVLLWLPDVIAWAYGRGGEWRTRASTVIRSVHTCP